MKGLCFRCEHRILNRETEGQHQPRCECGQDWSVGSCYMYEPVKPVILTPNEGDDRPVFGPHAISARMRGVEVADNIKLVAKELQIGKYLLYWDIKDESDEEEKS